MEVGICVEKMPCHFQVVDIVIRTDGISTTIFNCLGDKVISRTIG